MCFLLVEKVVGQAGKGDADGITSKLSGLNDVDHHLCCQGF